MDTGDSRKNLQGGGRGALAYNRRESASETKRATKHTLIMKASIRADTTC